MVNFEEFLLASFGEDTSNRELRLSNKELEFVKKKFPKAKIKPLSDNGPDEKAWFEISLIPPVNDQAALSHIEIEDIQRENERLRQELERLKKSVDGLAVM